MSIIETIQTRCVYCNSVLINSGDRICAFCNDVLSNYIEPRSCLYCHDLLEEGEICFLCKCGSYHITHYWNENGIDLLQNPYSIRVYNDIYLYYYQQNKNFIALYHRRTWQIATKFLKKSKGYGLKKREFLQKNFTWNYRSKYHSRKWNAKYHKKGLEKKKYKAIKFD